MKTAFVSLALLGSSVLFAQSDIAQNVQKKLSGDRFKDVHVSADGNTLTLTGSVRVLADKIDAENKAHKADKSANINNQLQVSSSASDAELQRKLSEKIAYDRVGYIADSPAFSAFQVRVDNGNVMLDGTAYNYPDRAQAIADIESTPGVKSLTENVEVAPASINDDELRLALYRRIYGNSVLSRYANDPAKPIRIIVINGHCTLYGTVDREMDKTVAGIQANQVPGVFSVDNKLVVAEQHNKKER
ncbi:MAG: BON domain-containing protein [Acidobacteriales bacterium]|nr:BON domain-containing protein [Terriglobales bacterium]